MPSTNFSPFVLNMFGCLIGMVSRLMYLWLCITMELIGLLANNNIYFSVEYTHHSVHIHLFGIFPGLDISFSVSPGPLYCFQSYLIAYDFRRIRSTYPIGFASDGDLLSEGTLSQGRVDPWMTFLRTCRPWSMLSHFHLLYLGSTRSILKYTW